MISARLLLFGSTLCLTACMGSVTPLIKPIASQGGGRATPFDRAFHEGKYQLANGRPGLAIVAFEHASQLDPSSIGALNGIGAAYDDLKRFDLAMGYYKRALRLAPRDADTMNNIAVSLRLAGDPAAAEWFARAAKLAPENEVIAANIVRARAEDTGADKPEAFTTEIASADEPQPQTDEAAPSLQRSGVGEFELGLPVKAVEPAKLVQTAAMVTVPLAETEPPRPIAANRQEPPAPLPVLALATMMPVPLMEIGPPKPILPATAMMTVPLMETDPAQPAAGNAEDAAASRPARPTIAVAVSNCVGHTHMAYRLGAFFRAKGVPVRRITDAPPFDCETSTLFTHAGHEAQAAALAQMLPQPVTVVTDETMTDDIRLVLGRDLLAFDRTLGG